MDLVGKLRHQHGNHRMQGRPCGQQAENTASYGEQQALGEQLAEQPPARGAHRQADGNLFSPAHGAGQQKVREVGAGNHQHQADRGQDHRAYA